jgi:hypothetical protein
MSPMRYVPVLLAAGLLGPAAAPAAAQVRGAVPPKAVPADEAPSDETMLKDAGVAADGPGLLEFFRRRGGEAADEGRVKALVARLGDDDFDAREQATGQLIAVGARARPLLRQALADPDVEVATRARECLRRIDEGATAAVVGAAVRELARRKPAGAVEGLLAYLPAAEDDQVAEEVRAALAALAARDGKPDPALVAALADKDPVRRAAAGVALCRAGAAGQRPAVRKLLEDADPLVRMRVALALAAAGEKDAVGVLIDALGPLPPQDTGPAVDLLCHLAGDKAPPPLAEADEPSRRRHRDAWKRWWDAEGDRIDGARVAEVSRELGHTLVLLLDRGKAIHLDGANRPLRQWDGLAFPLDVQLLPDDRLLVAEHNGGAVTERDRDNKVVWEKKVDGPLAAQRLPNGNTFIATRGQLLEVDKAGKEVWQYTPAGGAMVMKAQKVGDNEYACILQLGGTRFVRLRAEGNETKEVRSFGVSLFTSGGRVDVLPNGHVVVPESATNRVVEYSPDGRIVWEAAFESPVAAVRLRNGHTLVTSMNPQRGAVELDRDGRDRWQYRSDTRVTRALRR